MKGSSHWYAISFSSRMSCTNRASTESKAGGTRCNLIGRPSAAPNWGHKGASRDRWRAGEHPEPVRRSVEPEHGEARRDVACEVVGVRRVWVHDHLAGLASEHLPEEAFAE